MKVCKECSNPVHAKGLCGMHYMRKLRASNPEHSKAIAHDHYVKNKEKRSAQIKSYALANPELIKALARKSYLKTKTEKLAKQKERWLANPDIFRERVRRSIKRYPDRALHRLRKYQTKKLNAHPKWSIDFFIKEAYHLAALRTKCTGIKWHVDHIVPLTSPIVCGLHAHTNIQVIPAIQNIKKHNRTWPEMPT